METQKFKGDALELQIEQIGKPSLDQMGLALDDMFANGYNATEFLLGLFDNNRMPFSDRVPRDSFVEFAREALGQFPFTGTFESYIFILQAIFGEGSGVLFTVPGPGQLQMLVNAANSLTFEWIAKEFISGNYVDSTVVTSDGDTLVYSGVSGIDSEYELEQLLSEIIPAGIYTEITLAFFALYDFITDDGSNIVDHDGNTIVFFELGA